MNKRSRNGTWLWSSIFITIALMFAAWGTPAHGEEPAPTKPVTAQAAEFIKVDTLQWCLSASKVAFDLATNTVAHNWDVVATAKHIGFDDAPTTEDEGIKRAMFALLFAGDIHNALIYVKSTKAPREEHATRATQVMLESCAYQYGKNATKK